MAPLPTEIYSANSVSKIDKAAIDTAGISGYGLMTRAGQYAFDIARRDYPDAQRWQVICGNGNNGGDGYVVARLAMEQGIVVSVQAVSTPDALVGDAAKAYMDFAACGGVTVAFDGELDGEAELLVDGLLGSGLERELTGIFAAVVAAMNAHDAPVLALDMPSGLHADSGRVLGSAVCATQTASFVGLKPGLFLNDAPAFVGELAFSDLDIPAACRETEVVVLKRIDSNLVGSMLSSRQRSAHKGDFGRVLIVGGAPGMPGAVRICGEAALRAGAGSVEIATHPAHCESIPMGRPELMCRGVKSADDLKGLIDKADVVAIGPGLGTDTWSQALFDVALARAETLVIDADALNLLAEINVTRDDWILTPHPGEAGRLLGRETMQIQADRLAALSGLAEKFGGTVVLKGSGTLVSGQNGVPWLCTAGNPGMAAPGMGDALTGIVAALRGQGLSREMAAVIGVQVHSEAGDAAARTGERGLLATDLIAEIRRCVNQ